MDEKNYLPRIADDILSDYLKSFGAICIEGPKWCGKTWTARHHSESACMIADPTDNFAVRRLVALDINYAFQGESPHLIDEWQEFPALWDATRFHVDKKSEVGQFILTGSSTPTEKGIMHTGTGRIASFRMRPMSLWESGWSEGKVSLKSLCEGCDIGIVPTNRYDLNTLIEYILRGGWPGTIRLPFNHAVKAPVAYVRQIIEKDIARLDGASRDTAKIELLMRSLARNESTTANVSLLRRDIIAGDGVSVSEETLSSYLRALERLFVVENQKPFSSEMRSSVRVKQAEKRHFCDPSIAAALLKATSQKLLRDLKTLGFLFEALVVRDLRVYAQSFDAELYHYQDYNNKEIDAVIEMPDGEWIAVEIKLGANQEETAAQNLLKIKADFEKDSKGQPPKELVVITGLSSAAYRRPDGVYVVPITALKA